MRVYFIIFLLFNIITAHAFEDDPFQEYADFIETYINRSDVNVNARCHEQLKQYGIDLKDPKQWAQNMFAASASIPEGLFSRRNTDLGDFDQCLNIQRKLGYDFVSGKYCTGLFHLLDIDTPQTTAETSVALYNELAVCLPDGCNEAEIEKFWTAQTAEYSVTDVTCKTKADYSHTPFGYIIIKSILIIYLMLITSSTVYDVTVHSKNQKTSRKVLLAFSVCTNGKNLLTTSSYKEKIGCLDGIRVLSMMWIIMGHLCCLYFIVPLKNIDYFVKWYYKPLNFLLTHTFMLNVDTFFLMAGAVASYTFLRAKEFNLISYYTKRYLRLTPALLVVILIQMFVFKHLASGPTWPAIIENFNNGCDRYWWSALLYLQNYINPVDTCIISTWHISVDMQLYLLSPLLFIPLKRWPYRTLFLMVLLIVSSIIFRANVILMNNIIVVYSVEESLGFFSPTSSAFDQIAVNLSTSYAPTHTRASTWIMGTILGFVLHKTKESRVKLDKVTIGIFWTMAIAILSFCPLNGNYLLDRKYDALLHAIYESLNGPLWCLAMFWVIFACAHGYGGSLNSFLSLPIFEVMSKLTYSAYLVHYSLMQLSFGYMREAVTFSEIKFVEKFIAYYTFTMILAVAWYLLFECPVYELQSFYIKGKNIQITASPAETTRSNYKKKN